MATKKDNPTKKQQEIIDEVAEWIDTDVIAESIAEELVDCGMKVSLENMRLVWYNILQNALADSAKYAIEAIKEGWKS